MKIKFIVNTGKDSGIYVLSHTIAAALRERGIEVDIDHGTGHYDVIHIQNPLPIDFAAARLGHPLTPIVCSTNMTERELEGLIPWFLLPLAKAYIGFFYLFCKKIVCSSRELMNRIGSKGPYLKKCVFIPNPVDLGHFRRNEAKGKEFRKAHGINKKMVLCAASVQKRKGVFDFAELAKRMPQYMFVWAGQIPGVPSLENRKELEALVRDAGKNLVFTGYLERDGLAGAYSAADLFVFPTFAETFGLVVAEAAAAGLPVVARDLPEFGMFDDFILKFQNLDELEKKIVSILENWAEHKKFSELSRKHSKKFDPESYAEKLVEVYRDALKQ